MIRVALHNWVCSRVPFALLPTDRHPVGLVVPVGPWPWRKSNWHWMVMHHKVMQKNWHKTYWRRRIADDFFFQMTKIWDGILESLGNLERDREELLVTCKCLRWILRYFDIDISLDLDIFDIRLVQWVGTMCKVDLYPPEKPGCFGTQIFAIYTSNRLHAYGDLLRQDELGSKLEHALASLVPLKK